MEWRQEKKTSVLCKKEIQQSDKQNVLHSTQIQVILACFGILLCYCVSSKFLCVLKTKVQLF